MESLTRYLMQFISIGMKRKEFFKRLFLGGTSAVIGGALIAQTGNKTREVRLCSPYVAGFQFYKGEEIESRFKENDTLLLRRQPDNKYDRYAIEVIHGGVKIGYIPRDENRVVARMIDQNIEVKGRIAKIRPESPTWQRVKMRVYYDVV